ncbi:KOW domain-containing RNA-binding protein [Jeotgalibacillus proteolyticus]|uniref:KOW domain-containing RNA-binding protein n=1 Tax=Jeotgalibacillus proteolyticus TaxID=2082395 RepID=UPI003CED38F4
MFKSDSPPGIGQIVQVNKGRDTGVYAVVIHRLDDTFVLIADGERRKFDRPKKKNIQHLTSCDYISPAVQSSISETGRVTNGKLRHAVRSYVHETLKV